MGWGSSEILPVLIAQPASLPTLRFFGGGGAGQSREREKEVKAAMRCDAMRGVHVYVAIFYKGKSKERRGGEGTELTGGRYFQPEGGTQWRGLRKIKEILRQKDKSLLF